MSGCRSEPAAGRLDREERVVDGAQAQSRDHQQGVLQSDREIRDRFAIGQRAEKASDSLDQQDFDATVPPGGSIGQLREIDPRVFAPRCDVAEVRCGERPPVWREPGHMAVCWKAA